MKKNQLILLVFTLLLSTTIMAQSQRKSKAEGNFRLTGQLKELKDSVVVMLSNYGDSQRVPLRKYPVREGRIDITLTIENPQMMVLMMPGDYMHYITIPALSGENVNIEGSFEGFKMSGSRFYEQYAPIGERLHAMEAKMTADRIAYEKEYQRLVKNETENHQLMDANKAEYIKNYNSQEAKMRQELYDYIINHPQNEESATLLNLVEAEKVKTAISMLSPSVKNGRMKPVIEALQKQAENELTAKSAKERIKEGIEAPDFTLMDINGKPLSLSSLRGKHVVLDFWGSWCGWCIKGMPDMKKYYEKYKGKFEIVGVDCNDPVEKWKKAVKDNDLPWLHVYNSAADGTPEKYAVEGYPTKIIIDPQGKINKIIVGESEDFYKYLDELFK